MEPHMMMMTTIMGQDNVSINYLHTYLKNCSVYPQKWWLQRSVMDIMETATTVGHHQVTNF
jgi:hypothetical protein